MIDPAKDSAADHVEATSLPWYLSGTLHEDEQRRIAGHLASCAQCQQELRALAQQREVVRAALDAEPGPSPQARRRVMERIQSERRIAGQREPQGHPRRGGFGPLAAWLRVPWVPRWASAAALLLVTIQAGLLWRSLPTRAVQTDAVAVRSVAAARVRLAVVFKPGATTAQLQALLRELGATIVAGPSSAGVFTIELHDPDPRSVSAKIRAARSRGDVLQSVDLAPP
jgi:anti-sigma factor RsiW